MIRLDNKKAAGERNVNAMSTMCPTNCKACMPSGCACTKCFDSVKDTNEQLKKIYTK